MTSSVVIDGLLFKLYGLKFAIVSDISIDGDPLLSFSVSKGLSEVGNEVLHNACIFQTISSFMLPVVMLPLTRGDKCSDAWKAD